MTADTRITLKDELSRLLKLRIDLDYRARNPRTDPRHALEAEAARDLTDTRINAILAKLP